MTGLQMSVSDLAELHILLRVYIQCYDTAERDSGLLSEVEETYRRQYKRCNGGKDAPAEITNPRNAGRRPVHDPAQEERILRLRADGKTIREIAAAESCSASRVYRLIHETLT